MTPALLMARFQGSKQAFKVRNQVDLRRIALRRNNLTWIELLIPLASLSRVRGKKFGTLCFVRLQ